MSMTGVLRPVTALLLATAILMLGAGLQGVLLPLRAQIDGFTDVHIGLIGSAYFLGQLGGCLFAPNIIGRVGHIRAFAAFSAIASTTPLIHAMSADAAVWFALRLINGAAFAGILLVIESWLAAASEPETRGSVLGTYTLVHLTVVMAGMQMIALQSPGEFELFSLVAVPVFTGGAADRVDGSHSPGATEARQNAAALVVLRFAGSMDCGSAVRVRQRRVLDDGPGVCQIDGHDNR